MITFKRIGGNYIVSVDGTESICSTMWEAWEFIYTAYVRKIKNSL